jgi:hypothetical protein
LERTADLVVVDVARGDVGEVVEEIVRRLGLDEADAES